MTSPTPPTAIDGAPGSVADRLGTSHTVPSETLERIAASGAEVITDPGARVDAGRDWWPIGIAWAANGLSIARPDLIVRPTAEDQVPAVVAACADAQVPLTPMAGRSGVCGGSVPVFGGVSLDLTGLSGIVDLDAESLVADVRAGTFGTDLEAALRAVGSGYTLGHWPQSMDLSTVGGWVACRGAGQFSTRYGKIEDMVVGLDVVLADGTALRTEGSAPRAATGPNLSQLFIGSEGTLGVVTGARLRLHPLPDAETSRAYGFDTFAEGLDACRRILRRGATPAVLRLYDRVESGRHFELPDLCVMIVLDEGDRILVDATVAVVEDECRPRRPAGGGAAKRLDPILVDRWTAHRNDVSALAPLWRSGVVVDTAEVAARWRALPSLADEVLAALRSEAGTLVASVHQSHAYVDGACLYFTFAGYDAGAADPAHDLAWEEDYYRRAWDALTRVVMANGAAISHHHGIGLNRARFLPEALGAGFDVLVAIKAALDPRGIFNPGKLGLPSGNGRVPWP